MRAGTVFVLFSASKRISDIREELNKYLFGDLKMVEFNFKDWKSI